MIFGREKKKGRVFVGLSGGVDSAVSAALLQKEGYEVVGAFIRIALPSYPCTATEDRKDALRVAAHLQIPLREIDLSEAYRNKVFNYMKESYRQGETPNPDTLCNREIKFGLFFDWTMQEGADLVATGHYARTKVVEGRTHLLSGKDPEKDQSYFLWMISEEKLAKTLFPVGEMLKTEVRALAEKFSLPNAARKDSQGLCFLGDISIDTMLQKELDVSPGDVLNETGERIGAHQGAALYTIGQRHGFSIQVGSTESVPHYVVAKDMAANTLTVSSKEQTSPVSDTEGQEVRLREENWIGEVPSGPYKARFRYRQALMGAKLKREGKHSMVRLTEPALIPPGQSMVLYDGERCLGGGVIASR